MCNKTPTHLSCINTGRKAIHFAHTHVAAVTIAKPSHPTITPTATKCLAVLTIVHSRLSTPFTSEN